MSMVYSSITAAGDWQYASTSDIADINAVEVVALKAGYRHRVMAIQVTNTDATVGTVVQIRSGTTVLANLYVSPQVAATTGNNGYGVTFPMPLKGDVGANINVICVTTDALVRVSVQGVTEKQS